MMDINFRALQLLANTSFNYPEESLVYTVNSVRKRLYVAAYKYKTKTDGNGEYYYDSMDKNSGNVVVVAGSDLINPSSEYADKDAWSKASRLTPEDYEIISDKDEIIRINKDIEVPSIACGLYLAFKLTSGKARKGTIYSRLNAYTVSYAGTSDAKTLCFSTNKVNEEIENHRIFLENANEIKAVNAMRRVLKGGKHSADE